MQTQFLKHMGNWAHHVTLWA